MILTVKKVSQMLHVNEETVRRWIRNEELVAEKKGKSYIIQHNVLKEFIDSKSQEAGSTIARMVKLGVGITELTDITNSSVVGVGAEVLFNPKLHGSSELALYDLDNLIHYKKLNKERREHEYTYLIKKLEMEIFELETLREEMSRQRD
ncbi:helix-turn-helix domain-containing protein [Mesobacillus foraminis]|uniref:helix-turn-helix domain-containing protein n=1 Tax=Mesobacillus foraminis TaxID=279826 RepID=UPI001BE8D1D9|nr:helix-turn-helix domain-containing protein [Mesobacillus foraminis]MBT2755889.1 helix-turn-helix domain-containing protein [Mesobacillus foraminis]